jgi:hypothetical protein
VLNDIDFFSKLLLSKHKALIGILRCFLISAAGVCQRLSLGANEVGYLHECIASLYIS